MRSKLILASIFLLSMVSTECIAQELMQRLFSPRLGADGVAVNAGFSGLRSEKVQGQAANFSASKLNLSIASPVFVSANNEAGFGVSLAEGLIETTAIMPTTLTPVPETYSSIGFGPYFKHVFENKWMIGANVQVGSSSDEPFTSINVMNIGANVALRVPSGERNAWVAFVNYSSNRDFLRHVPIPGFGYSFDADWGRGMIGVPALSVQLLHKKPVNFVVRYFPVITTYAEVGYDISKMFRIAAAFAWHDDHFWRSARTVDRYQTFIVQKDLGLQLSIKPERFISFKLGAGFTFDRYLFEGRSVVRDTSYNRMNFNAAPYASVSVTAIAGGNRKK